MAIMAPSFTSLVFTVRRCEPELVSPAKPTPHEFNQLSDLDDRDSLRFQIPIIQFYKYNPLMQGRDTVKVIREALSQTLTSDCKLESGWSPDHPGLEKKSYYFISN